MQRDSVRARLAKLEDEIEAFERWQSANDPEIAANADKSSARKASRRRSCPWVGTRRTSGSGSVSCCCGARHRKAERGAVGARQSRGSPGTT